MTIFIIIVVVVTIIIMIIIITTMMMMMIIIIIIIIIIFIYYYYYWVLNQNCLSEDQELFIFAVLYFVRKDLNCVQIISNKTLYL